MQQQLSRCTIVHRYQIIRPKALLIRVQQLDKVCTTQSYLDCVTETHEVEAMTRAFAAAIRDPSIAEPAAFARRLCEEHPEWELCQLDDD